MSVVGDRFSRHFPGKYRKIYGSNNVLDLAYMSLILPSFLSFSIRVTDNVYAPPPSDHPHTPDMHKL